MRFLTPEEVEHLANTIGPEYSTLVRFAAYTGLRAGEVAALKVKRLDLMRGSVNVTESLSEAHGEVQLGPTKTYASRSVALPRLLVDDLAEHLAVRGIADDPEAFVFATPTGEPMRPSNWYPRHFKPAVEAAGLAPLRFHDLRHTCAALLIAQGAHPRTIMERLGHSSVTTSLDRYGHLLPSLDEALTEGLDEVMSAAASENLADFSRTTADVLEFDPSRKTL